MCKKIPPLDYGSKHSNTERRQEEKQGKGERGWANSKGRIHPFHETKDHKQGRDSAGSKGRGGRYMLV